MSFRTIHFPPVALLSIKSSSFSWYHQTRFQQSSHSGTRRFANLFIFYILFTRLSPFS